VNPVWATVPIGLGAMTAYWRVAYARTQPQGRVLAFHQVERGPLPGAAWVSPRFFEKTLDLLTTLDVEVAPAASFSDGLGRENTVAITFDDGYERLLEHAFPALIERGMHSTVFVIPSVVGRTNTWDYSVGGWGRRRHLDWRHLRELAENGVEIGSHTTTHRDLTRLSDAELSSELFGSRREIEDRIGRPVRLLSYPFGRYDKRAQRAAKKAGYDCAFTTAPRAFESDLSFAVARRGVYAFDTLLDIRLLVRSGPLSWLEDLRGFITTRWAAATPLVLGSSPRTETS
jgi:peptidoglycan/xylan/chitin deacetylase (PgdA/CDA1 family)